MLLNFYTSILILVSVITLVGATTFVPSSVPSAQPSQQPFLQPSAQPSETPSGQPSEDPSRQPTSQPSTPTSQPSTQPTLQPIIQPTSTPSAQPSSNPTLQPTTQPTDQPSKQPSSTPSSQPSSQPGSQPSNQPSQQPSSVPSTQPSTQPTNPTAQPSSQPSGQPSSEPTTQPSVTPTAQPSASPSSQPSIAPSSQPSLTPSSQPSSTPTCQPSRQPTREPTAQPSAAPSLQPSARPTSVPSTQPSTQPSSQPTSPTSVPTNQPSSQPSAVPSQKPSAQPTSRPSPIPPCPAGSSYDLTGHSTPGDPDVIGYYECVVCEAGYFTSEPKQPTCQSCPPGQFSDRNSTGCTLCPLNTYAEGNGMAACTPCANGEVNGLPGSALSSDCVNPAINFIMGSVALMAAVFAIIVYMWFGRLHRIAFQRKFRLIRKLIMMYGIVLTTADMITRASSLLMSKFGNTVAGANSFRERFLKPYVLFPLGCFIVVLGVTFLYIFKSSIKIVFTAMVLWRAYKRLQDLDFKLDFLDPFLQDVGDVVGSQQVIDLLAYPAVYVSGNIADLNINLDAVELKCPGAQIPMYLVTAMFVVAVVIIVIESDVHVFWTMMIEPTLGKIRSLIFSPQYFRRNFCSTIFYLVISMMISEIPGPDKLVQYTLGFVVTSKFFNLNGSGINWVFRSDNCDAAVGIPMDSILAVSSALFAIFVFPAVVYLLSVVLFPNNLAAERTNTSLTPISHTIVPSPPAAQPAPLSSESTKYSLLASLKKFPNLTGEYDSSDDECGFGVTDDIDTHLFRPKNSYSDKREEKEEKEDEEEIVTTMEEGIELTTASSSGVPLCTDSNLSAGRLSPLSPGSFHPLSPSPVLEPESSTVGDEEDQDEENINSLTGQLSKLLRVASSSFALDWIFLAIVYYLGVSVFSSQRNFLMTKYMVHTAHRRDPLDPKTCSNRKVEVYVDAFTYDKDLKKLRKYASSAQLRRLPLCDGLVTTDHAEAIADRQEEDEEWKIVETTLPSYFDLAQEVYREMNGEQDNEQAWLEKYFPYSRNLLCHLFPTQIMLTKAGRTSWYRVAKTYVGLILLCVGIWPEWLVEDLKLIKKFEEFNNLNEMLYREVGDRVFKKPQEDAFTKIDNDEKVAFGQFVAALTTCRIALLQIFPNLTAGALLFSAVASTPLIVLSPTMNAKLPPLIATNTYKDAYDWLKEDYKKEPSRLQVAFLSYYMVVNQSRLIQCFINGFMNMISIAIIFFPERLKYLVPTMISIMTHQGLLASFYVVLLFQKLLFPEITVEEENERV